jgi:hypothetical protein
MGNICSGGKEEGQKDSAFRAAGEGSGLTDVPAVSGGGSALPVTERGVDNHPQSRRRQHPSEEEEDPSRQARDAARERQSKVETARQEMIVQATGRGMVAVRSTRGATGYYDQGFAAALRQHLEQTATFPDRVPVRLPEPSSAAESVYQRLSQPAWDGIAVGTKDGQAGLAGENPVNYVDHVAESYLDAVLPAKERLFQSAKPIIENLL